MSLSRTVNEKNGDFGRKFFPPRVFCALIEGVPLGIGYQCWVAKKLEWSGCRADKEVWRYVSAVWISVFFY